VAVLQAEDLNALPVGDAIAAVNRLVPKMPNDAFRRIP
jgi:hypothetical protein